MNTLLLLTKARKEAETARAKAAADEKTATIARQTARAAKLKLKHARKLAKLAKKSARKADDQAEASLDNSDRAQSKLEKLEKRAKKEQRKKKLAKPAHGKRSAKPAAPDRKQVSSRHRAKSKTGSGSGPNNSILPLSPKPARAPRNEGITHITDKAPVVESSAEPGGASDSGNQSLEPGVDTPDASASA